MLVGDVISRSGSESRSSQDARTKSSLTTTAKARRQSTNGDTQTSPNAGLVPRSSSEYTAHPYPPAAAHAGPLAEGFWLPNDANFHSYLERPQQDTWRWQEQNHASRGPRQYPQRPAHRGNFNPALQTTSPPRPSSTSQALMPTIRVTPQQPYHTPDSQPLPQNHHHSLHKSHDDSYSDPTYFDFELDEPVRSESHTYAAIDLKKSKAMTRNLNWTPDEEGGPSSQNLSAGSGEGLSTVESGGIASVEAALEAVSPAPSGLNSVVHQPEAVLTASFAQVQTDLEHLQHNIHRLRRQSDDDENKGSDTSSNVSDWSFDDELSVSSDPNGWRSTIRTLAGHEGDTITVSRHLDSHLDRRQDPVAQETVINNQVVSAAK